MSISLTRVIFDSRIMIYMEFCIRKGLILWGEETNFRGKAKKNSSYVAAGLRMPGNRATVINPLEEFSKTLMYYYTSASGLRSLREKPCLLPIPWVPHVKNQKHGRVCPNWSDFSISVAGHLQFWPEV